MTLLTSQLAPMHILETRILKGSHLEHERSKGGSADKTETGLDGASGAGRLGGSRGAGAVGGTSGGGTERAGDSQGAGGEDGGVVDGGAGAGDVAAGGADRLDSGGVGSNDGRLDRRRSNRVACRGGRGDGVASGSGGGDGVASRSGALNWRNGAGRNDNGAVVLGDTELGRVLVLAGNIVNQLESIAGAVGLEGGSWRPDEGTRVVDALSKSLDGDNVDGGATEQQQRDCVGGGWLPSDGESLASRDNLSHESATVFCFELDTTAQYIPRSRDE